MTGELKKLLIEAYTDEHLGESDKAYSYQVLFNPATFQRKYEIEYKEAQGQGTSGTAQKFGYIKPQEFSFEFTFDGTGAAGLKIDVAKEIQRFLETTGKMNGDIHRPLYLKISWGSFLSKCVLKQADITYTLFKPDGYPLRAKVSATFLGTIEDVLRLAFEKAVLNPAKHVSVGTGA